MTNAQYLEKYRWKRNGYVWISPFTKFEYDENSAMEVEYMLKGKKYVLDKMAGIPDSFTQGIEDIAAGRYTDMEKALKEIDLEE